MLRRRESPRTCIRLPLRNSRGPFRFESGTGTRNRREPDGRPTTAPSRPTHTRLHSYTYAQLPEPVHTRTPALVHEHAPKPSSPESGICQRKGDSSLVNGPAPRAPPPATSLSRAGLGPAGAARPSLQDAYGKAGVPLPDSSLRRREQPVRLPD